jgi:hypothetical protein
MTTKRPVTTKALSAYLKAQHTSLSAAISMIGLDQECLEHETITDDTLGRIARLRGTTAEVLAAATAQYA